MLFGAQPQHSGTPQLKLLSWNKTIFDVRRKSAVMSLSRCRTYCLHRRSFSPSNLWIWISAPISQTKQHSTKRLRLRSKWNWSTPWTLWRREHRDKGMPNGKPYWCSTKRSQWKCSCSADVRSPLWHPWRQNPLGFVVKTFWRIKGRTQLALSSIFTTEKRLFPLWTTLYLNKSILFMLVESFCL